MAYRSKQLVDRYLFGEWRPRRALRFFLHDLLVEAAIRLQSRLKLSLVDGAWLPAGARVNWLQKYSAYELRQVRDSHNYSCFRTPANLQVTYRQPQRVLVIGSCMAHPWQEFITKRGVQCELVEMNFLSSLPVSPPRPAAEYDFHILQLPIRSILPDVSLARLAYDDIEGHRKLLDHARQMLSRIIAEFMQWNKKYGIPTFVANFFVPQQNPSGRLLPRYDLRNPVYFIEELNRTLCEELQIYKNAYLLDVDQIAATFGKKYVQDDSICAINHGSTLGNYDLAHDLTRIEPVVPLTEHYIVRRDEFHLAIWAELVAMYRTLRQENTVKLVILDLDDTLWRGVAVEEENLSSHATEGWPLGLMEALCFLKKRGIMLAIVSKNDEAKINDVWDRITFGRIRMDDFVVRKINWAPKAQNVEEIIGAVNVLPRNVLFIDDNPVERASVKAAFPDIRTLDGRHYYWRRELLWAPETQSAMVTSEAIHRTQMVQAQIERNDSQKRLSREEFLGSLCVKIRLFKIDSAEHPNFTRTFELLNKTNQFNTTGRRWTQQECRSALAEDTAFFAFEVEDKFTHYGLVGVIIVTGFSIDQFVMSCRVLGLDVEVAAISEIVRRMSRDGRHAVTGVLTSTNANQPCRDVFRRCGFEQVGDVWSKPAEAVIEKPSHVLVA